MWPLRLKASLSAQNNRDKYAYARSGTKIKSDVRFYLYQPMHFLYTDVSVF